MAKDGVSDPQPGKGESGGGAWKGKNEAPAHPQDPVVTHNVRETAPVRNRDKTSEADRAR